MPAFEYFRESLLEPISPQQPCGADLRHDRLFSDVLDARRADDQLNPGAWEKKEGPKFANWEKVSELCLDALATRTRDLRLACFLTEAALHLDGFQGFGSGVRLCRELLVRFWDHGLYPIIEDGDLDYRAASLSAINDLLPDALRQLPLVVRGGEDYNYVRFQQAQRLATENNPATIAGLKKQGYITMEAFNGALKATPLAELQTVYSQIDAAEKELVALGRASDERFGDAAPSFTGARGALVELKHVLDPILAIKGKEADGSGGAETAGASGNRATGDRLDTLAGLTAGLPGDQSRSWSDAEALIRAGKVDQGLAQMAALAANESSGRARFLRKLMLADVCLNSGRERLARTILEELKEQITQFKLNLWESSALVGAVWSRLYKLYRKSDRSSEQEMAANLYTQLCQLDPWQAYLHCED